MMAYCSVNMLKIQNYISFPTRVEEKTNQRTLILLLTILQRACTDTLPYVSERDRYLQRAVFSFLGSNLGAFAAILPVLKQPELTFLSSP